MRNLKDLETIRNVTNAVIVQIATRKATMHTIKVLKTNIDVSCYSQFVFVGYYEVWLA